MLPRFFMIMGADCAGKVHNMLATLVVLVKWNSIMRILAYCVVKVHNLLPW